MSRSEPDDDVDHADAEQDVERREQQGEQVLLDEVVGTTGSTANWPMSTRSYLAGTRRRDRPRSVSVSASAKPKKAIVPSTARRFQGNGTVGWLNQKSEDQATSQAMSSGVAPVHALLGAVALDELGHPADEPALDLTPERWSFGDGLAIRPSDLSLLR